MKRASIFSLGVLLAIAACVLPEPAYVLAGCVEDEDCPTDMRCLVTARYSGKYCVPNAVTFSDYVDAGEAYYCDVKPVLDTYCVGCHAEPPANSAPNTFRLDVYEGAEPAAKAMAERVALRSYRRRDMPPASFPAPTNEERLLLLAFWQTGAQLCGPDGGSADGG